LVFAGIALKTISSGGALRIGPRLVRTSNSRMIPDCHGG
jgi:hypothetical protein